MLVKKLWKRFPGIPNGFYQMWCDIKPFVRDRRGKICHLQGHYHILAFANSDGVYVGEFPWSASISPVIISGTGHEPSFFVGQIYSQSFSETEAADMFSPFCKTN